MTALNKKHLYRVTKGSCTGSISKGILLTVSKSVSHSTPITQVEKSVCIDPNDATIASNFGSGLDFSAVGLAVAEDGDDATIVLQEETAKVSVFVL